MTDAEILAEGALYGQWLPPYRNPVNTDKPGKTARPVERVAIVGGLKFDEPALDRWLVALQRKYAGCTIVTGASRGAEAFVIERATELGLAVEVPPIPDTFVRHPLTTRRSMLERLEQVASAGVAERPTADWQVTDIVVGADAIVTVGSPNGTRAKIAGSIHKRVDEGIPGGRPLVNVAQISKPPR